LKTHLFTQAYTWSSENICFKSVPNWTELKKPVSIEPANELVEAGFS